MLLAGEAIKPKMAESGTKKPVVDEQEKLRFKKEKVWIKHSKVPRRDEGSPAAPSILGPFNAPFNEI